MNQSEKEHFSLHHGRWSKDRFQHAPTSLCPKLWICKEDLHRRRRKPSAGGLLSGSVEPDPFQCHLWLRPGLSEKETFATHQGGGVSTEEWLQVFLEPPNDVAPCISLLNLISPLLLVSWRPRRYHQISCREQTGQKFKFLSWNHSDFQWSLHCHCDNQPDTLPLP